MIFCHGTNERNAVDILMNGFRTRNKIWNCSNPNLTYMWQLSPEDEDADYGLIRAKESGIIACAKTNAKSSYVYVLVLDIPEKYVDEYCGEVHSDRSGKNMAAFEAFEVESKWLNSKIEAGEITVKVYRQKLYNPAFRYFYLTGANIDLMSFSEEDIKNISLAKDISGDCNTSVLLDDVYDLDSFESYCKVEAGKLCYLHNED